MFLSHPHRARVEQMVTLVVATCLALLATSAGAAAHTNQPTATISSAALHIAIAKRTAAERALAHDSRRLSRCLRAHPNRCGADRRAAKRSRARLAGAKRRVTSLAARVARSHSTSSATKQAPKLTVSGQTLRWNAVTGVSSYVFVRKVPGLEAQYTTITGTSTTPATVPGETVHYSVRTNVEGSAWATEVSITYPATAPSTPPAPVEPSSSSPSGSSMWISVDAGGWGPSVAPDIKGAVNYVRLEDPTSISGFTAAGLKVIDDMAGPYNTGGVKALNVNEWVAKAVAFVKANPQVAAVEVLNEASGSWFWGENADSTENAAAYDRLLKAVHEAFVAEFGSARPLILASYGGPGEEPVWGERLWAANPNVGSYCDGVVVHPYPSSGRGEADRKQVEQAHANTGKPVYVTEVGWNTSVVTEAEQAQNITNFIDWARSTGYVADVNVFNYRNYGPSSPSEDWGIETWEGQHKLAYAALAAFLS